MNAATTATPTPTPTSARPPYRGAEYDPLRTEPIRPSGEAGDGWGRAAAYDAYADGLHTYAIWSLRDHDAAVDALYCAFVMADRHVTQLRSPEHVHPWLYALMRHECQLRIESPSSAAPSPVSGRLRPPSGSADPDGSLAALERNLRRAEFHSLEWPESEGLAPAHREILELTIRHGLDSQGLGLVLGLGQPGRTTARSRAGNGKGSVSAGLVGSAGSQGFGILADAWRELERSLAAVAVAKGSREHCAQLAELTFGWSGRLTAALRAPLTDHVDACTRCQHYLHTVIGTPAAPTILPFVAAPRALRDILLGELHDPNAARDAGVDHDAIAQRLENFTADGFPASAEPAPVRRRSGRRAQTQSASRSTEPSPHRRQPKDSGKNEPVKNNAGRKALRRTEPQTDDTLPRRTPGVNRPRAGTSAGPGQASDTVYRAPGSWAARVLPPEDCPDSTRHWHPIGPAAASTTERLTATQATDATQGRGASEGPAASPSRRRASGTPTGSGTPARPTFVATPSGRFAVQVPPASPRAAVPNPPTAPLPRAQRTARQPARFVTPAAEPPRGPDGKPRPRHKSRPVRQAVTSAVALGAVGAVAAAAAALLGLTSEEHPQGVLGDPQLSLPTSSSTDSGGLSVTVSTAPGVSTSSTAHAQPSSVGSPAVSLSASTGQSPAGGAGSASVPPGVNPADFHVSVNQRSGDPNTISILLRNTGPVSIPWSANAQDSWIALSQTSGTLGAGQSVVITATATSAAPAGQWTSHVTFSPGGTVLTIRGGTAPPPSSAPPTTPPPSTSPPSPTPTPSGSTPGPTPSGPSSTPTGSGPSPSAVRQSGSSSASSTPSAGPTGSRPPTPPPAQPGGHH